MKLTYTKEVVLSHGAQILRWRIRDGNGATLATTRTREDARNLVRKIKAEGLQS